MHTNRDAARSLVTPTMIGMGLQLLMVVMGHFSPSMARLFAPGGMSISAIAGLMAALIGPAPSLGSAAGRGAVAGGVCAFAGILVSHLLGDVPAEVLGFGTVGSAFAGALGGLVGKVVSVRSARAVQRA
jgi:hypothetical protein